MLKVHSCNHFILWILEKISFKGGPNCIAVGSTRKDRKDLVVPGYDEGSIGYFSDGQYVDKNSENVGTQWENGDVIECGTMIAVNTFPYIFPKKVNLWKKNVVRYRLMDFIQLLVLAIAPKWNI